MAKSLPLEGPKKHHSNHGPDASVPAKGKRAVPNEHWEQKYDSNVHRNSKNVSGASFDPMCSNERKVTYNKVNKEDH